ncbi:MAG: M20/M25/M40 family metallo-hydrolase, partial [Deltaproteobacteria bacterium]|nr:M20/M25/M40 family metallo-hydrolase [Deltaproteobacteria bacterium]
MHTGTTIPTPDKRLMDACAAAKPFFIETLRDLVNMDSGTDNTTGLNRKKDYIAAAMQRTRADVTVLDAAGPRAGTYNIKAERRGKGKGKILLICHYDTVWPEGEAAKRPFTIKENIAYGPGVADAQHSIAGIITLFKIAAELRCGEFDTLSAVMNADEEKGSLGSKDLLLEESSRHDVVFSMEGGGIDADRIIIGVRGNNNATITVKGRAAHSGENPQDGRNAGEELAHQMIQMRGLSCLEKRTDTNWTTGSFGTMHNIIPDTATATMNVRTALASEADRVEAAMRERIKNVSIAGCTISLEFTRIRPPFECTPLTEKLAAAAQKVYHSELGRELTLSFMGGASDANFACRNALVLEGMGMGGTNWHALSECLALDGVPDRLYLLLRMIQMVSGGD